MNLLLSMILTFVTTSGDETWKCKDPTHTYSPTYSVYILRGVGPSWAHVKVYEYRWVKDLMDGREFEIPGLSLTYGDFRRAKQGRSDAYLSEINIERPDANETIVNIKSGSKSLPDVLLKLSPTASIQLNGPNGETQNIDGLVCERLK